jgi:hypothetical protein
MNTFENIIMRTEQLMNRFRNIASMESLCQEYNVECFFINNKVRSTKHEK